MENMITKKFNEKDVVNEGIVKISIDIEQEKLEKKIPECFILMEYLLQHLKKKMS